MKRVVLIGMGAIGRSILHGWRARPPHDMSLAAICVRSEQAADAARVVGKDLTVLTDPAQLMAFGPDIVIESAGHGGLAAWGAAALESGADLYVLSVGALADPDLRADLEAAASNGGGAMILPPGALAGFDGLLSLRRAGLRSVVYTSIKPPLAWVGTPAEAFDLASLNEPTTIFKGSSVDAARFYPKNANLSAAVALAGIGFERTVVELVADPEANENTSRLYATGDGGTLRLDFAGPSLPDNPKSSAVVGFSVLAALDKCSETIRFA